MMLWPDQHRYRLHNQPLPPLPTAPITQRLRPIRYHPHFSPLPIRSRFHPSCFNWPHKWSYLITLSASTLVTNISALDRIVRPRYYFISGASHNQSPHQNPVGAVLFPHYSPKSEASDGQPVSARTGQPHQNLLCMCRCQCICEACCPCQCICDGRRVSYTVTRFGWFLNIVLIASYVNRDTYVWLFKLTTCSHVHPQRLILNTHYEQIY